MKLSEKKNEKAMRRAEKRAARQEKRAAGSRRGVFAALWAKKGLRAVAVVLLCALLGGGALVGARAFMGRGKTLGVFYVGDIANTWFGYDAGSYGVITTGGAQNVYADSELLVDAVFVTEGESVRKGQELMRYDITLLKLAAESKRLQYEMAKNDLAKAQKQLEYYKTFKPYTEPAVLVTDTLALVDETLFATRGEGESAEPVYITGSGTAADPYLISCSIMSEVTPAFLKALLQQAAENGEARAAVLQLWHTMDGCSSTVIAEWTVSTDSYTEQDVDALMGENWALGKQAGSGEPFIKVSDGEAGDGSVAVLTALAQSPFGTLRQLRDSAYPDEPPYEESLTQAEIDALIREQTQYIRSAQISVKQAELDYKQAKAQVSDGTVYAAMDGVVSFVGDKSAPVVGEPFITVQTGTGYQITSTLSEPQLGEVKVGDSIEIMLWSTGESCTAVITSISNFPTNNSYSYGYVNPNSSFYSFTAELDYEGELRYGEGGEITFGAGAATGETFAIESSFVREEGGRSYVLKVGENDRIVKQYVEIGRSLSGGYYLEILSGLTMEDYIGFPYGKNAVEGAQADYDVQGYYW